MSAAEAAGASPTGDAHEAGHQARNETRGTVLAHRLIVGASLWSRFRGLMGRRSLPTGEGLFLPGTNGIHMFFMRFPIDAVFVGKRGAGGERPVLSVHRRVRPWIGIVPLVRGAAGVLEVPVGTIDASGTAPGDSLRVD
jgi:uncharacterized membrane protein (UPF0127 family)